VTQRKFNARRYHFFGQGNSVSVPRFIFLIHLFFSPRFCVFWFCCVFFDLHLSEIDGCCIFNGVGLLRLERFLRYLKRLVVWWSVVLSLVWYGLICVFVYVVWSMVLSVVWSVVWSMVWSAIWSVVWSVVDFVSYFLYFELFWIILVILVLVI